MKALVWGRLAEGEEAPLKVHGVGVVVAFSRGFPLVLGVL